MRQGHLDSVALFSTGWKKFGLLLGLAIYLLGPLMLSDFQLSVIDYAGIAAIGAIGLNVLTGYTGQISLGHGFFLGAGAFTAAYFGGNLDLPLPLWLAAAAVVGALIGLVIGPFALRLKGSYLAIITLGLVFLGQHIFENWKSVTGGLSGRAVTAPVKLGPVDFANLDIGGKEFSREGGYFYLIWAVVALVALLVKNLMRTRLGRAFQAVRDRDAAAEVIGVRLARTKVMSFVVSSSLAAVAGALYGSFQRFVNPEEFGLFLSIEFVAMIVIGGAATIYGPVLGALFITAVPFLIEEWSDRIPGVATEAGETGITVFALNQALFGLLIIGFLVLEPRGLAALWARIKVYFLAWPFSY
ncbi:MAG: branched-chain amino acid ABC transporter permease [Actinomycetia bacterium]|nr:branched-chain amino acid ABC transporter permease [Actinomycetes bacterium]MCP4958227.1 branched-chain amino acid ABC transporter permease [Actinomycetes bacterium]